MVVTLGQQYHVGEKPTVILYTYINRHAQGHQTIFKNKRQKGGVAIIYDNLSHSAYSLPTQENYSST